MSPTPQLPFEIKSVSLFQGQSFEPFLRIILKINLEDNGNNRGISELSFLGIKGVIHVSAANDSTREIGLAETIPNSYSIYKMGGETNPELRLRLSPYILHRIEKLRNGNDLYFSLNGYWNAFANVVREGITTVENVTLSSRYGNPIFKYARSEWIDDLNKTDFDKTELIEVPRIEFAQIAPTENVMKYLRDAERAMREGRWDDVFGECRKTVNALYVGIEEWGDKMLPQADKDAIQNTSGSDKTNAKRNLYFTKLVQNDEKGERLNNLRNSLYKYLSLDPHQPDHKGVHFTREDAEFALRVTASFCANMLNHLGYHLSKEKQ